MRVFVAVLLSLLLLGCAAGGTPDPATEAPPPEQDQIRLVIDNQYWGGGHIVLFDADNFSKMVRIDLGGSGLYFADLPWNLVEGRELGAYFEPTAEDMHIIGQTPGTRAFQRITVPTSRTPFCIELKGYLPSSGMATGAYCRRLVEEAQERGRKTS